MAWCLGILSYRGAYQVRAFRQVAGGSSGVLLSRIIAGRQIGTRWPAYSMVFE